MIRLYRYIGPEDIAQVVAHHPAGHPLRRVADVEHWMEHTRQQPNRWGLIEATFVFSGEGVLRLSDRHTEHMACAGGQAVHSAREMYFARGTDGWAVHEVSNQSTGYCPEPASWPAVARALEQIPLPHPGTFTQAYLFRRCPACQQSNLIKEDILVCALCGLWLPKEWNCQDFRPH